MKSKLKEIATDLILCNSTHPGNSCMSYFIWFELFCLGHLWTDGGCNVGPVLPHCEVSENTSHIE